MLKVINQVRLKRATNPEHGSIQTFLEQLLVEVVSGNYRYFLNEHLINSAPDLNEAEAYCWPPLLANERQVSGLFANALAAVCPVSRPEFTISRPGVTDKRGKEGPERSGRIDFFATYGKRCIGLELKQIPISSLGDTSAKRGLSARWDSVKEQSSQALSHFRGAPSIYPHPVTVGLLVIRVSRKVSKKKAPADVRTEAVNQMTSMLRDIGSRLKPDFLAHYVPPVEMQTFLGWGKNEDEYRVFPGVIFAGVVHGKRAAKR